MVKNSRSSVKVQLRDAREIEIFSQVVVGNTACTSSKQAVKILTALQHTWWGQGRSAKRKARGTPKQSTGSPGNSSETQLVNLTESPGTMLFL